LCFQGSRRGCTLHDAFIVGPIAGDRTFLLSTKDGTVLSATPHVQGAIPGHPVSGPASPRSRVWVSPADCVFVPFYRENHSRFLPCCQTAIAMKGRTWEAPCYSPASEAIRLDCCRRPIMVRAGNWRITKNILNSRAYVDKWTSFASQFAVAEDGNDFGQSFPRPQGGKRNSAGPRCIIAERQRSRNLFTLENRVEWHYLP